KYWTRQWGFAFQSSKRLWGWTSASTANRPTHHITVSKLLKQGCQRGEAPELRQVESLDEVGPALRDAEGTGVWGCPPDSITTPFLARKRAGGWSKRGCHHPARILSTRRIS
ncbi:MAG: hypothetical protein Q7R39_18075, partial [Dehalococcoidia bacterium]|nr:hypothetical protein [Dehalococcoidia bacterium]